MIGKHYSSKRKCIHFFFHPHRGFASLVQPFETMKRTVDQNVGASDLTGVPPVSKRKSPLNPQNHLHRCSDETDKVS